MTNYRASLPAAGRRNEEVGLYGQTLISNYQQISCVEKKKMPCFCEPYINKNCIVKEKTTFAKLKN
jgi:hypothetical protein